MRLFEKRVMMVSSECLDEYSCIFEHQELARGAEMASADCLERVVRSAIRGAKVGLRRVDGAAVGAVLSRRCVL